MTSTVTGAVATAISPSPPAQTGHLPPTDFRDEHRSDEQVWAPEDFTFSGYTQPSPSTRSSVSSGSFSNPSNPNGNAFPGSLPGSSTSPSEGTNSDDKTERVVIEVRSTSGGRARIRRFYHNGPAAPWTGSSVMDVHNLMEPSGDIDLNDPASAESLPQVDMLLRQMWPELSPDLPTPNTIRHMAELCT